MQEVESFVYNIQKFGAKIVGDTFIIFKIDLELIKPHFVRCLFDLKWITLSQHK